MHTCIIVSNYVVNSRGNTANDFIAIATLTLHLMPAHLFVYAFVLLLCFSRSCFLFCSCFVVFVCCVPVCVFVSTLRLLK